jgi:hypothetical protein
MLPTCGEWYLSRSGHGWRLVSGGFAGALGEDLLPDFSQVTGGLPFSVDQSAAGVALHERIY